MRGLAILVALGLASAAAAAEIGALSLFGGGDFQPGRYQFSAAAGNGATSNRCIITPDMLLHVGLEEADRRDCAHTVIEDTGERATVAYSCRGLGSGRTTIIKDNRNHFTIDAQGIRNREPFAMRQEARRVGDCG